MKEIKKVNLEIKSELEGLKKVNMKKEENNEKNVLNKEEDVKKERKK